VSKAPLSQPLLGLLQLFSALMLLSLSTYAQTFKVIHTFSDGKDGAYSYAGLTIDSGGNLYGTANQGGNDSSNCFPTNACGTVFELSPSTSGWKFKVIYAFHGGTNDGQNPYGAVSLGPKGVLYGATIDGGIPNCPSGCGLAYSLTPPSACITGPCPWTESILYKFNGDTDGFYPAGALTLDSLGNLYGATTQGGTNGPGTVFELTPSGGSWTESIIQNFDGSDGANPYNGVTLAPTGNLYISTPAGGNNGSGSIVELTPSGGGWSETVVHLFSSTDPGGEIPMAGVLVEPSGALIGVTEYGGSRNDGVVYSLSSSGSAWTLTPLFGLVGGAQGPWGGLIQDSQGNLYGTTQGGGRDGNLGTVFKLTPTDGGWKETVLHRFTGGADGSLPLCSLVLDSAGNLYGTTNLGGVSTNGGYGVIFEITP
jgi:uncharacterized repeat protein (TIGR03803 family)